MFMRVFSILILWSIFSTSILAETYIREYSYNASEADSKLSSRIIALDQVRVILLSEVGSHIKQIITVNKDASGQIDAREDIEAITAGMTEVEILEEQWDGSIYYLKVKINVDTNKVIKELKDLQKNNIGQIQSAEMLKENQQEIKRLRKNIDELKIKIDDKKGLYNKSQLIVAYEENVAKLSAADMYLIGRRMYEKEDYDKAIEWYKKSASKDNFNAQMSLGHMYDTGKGVKKNDGIAVKWYIKAASHNVDYAQMALGLMYETGRGVAEDKAKAFELYKKSAEQGYYYGQYAMGQMLRNSGEYEESIHWYKKALEQGLERAREGMNKSLEQLAFRYEFELNDYEKAISLYLEAANNRSGSASFKLYEEYSSGENINVNLNKALYWLRKAVDLEHDNAVFTLHEIELLDNGFDEESAKWISKANQYYYWASMGKAEMQFKLGYMYEGGVGVKKDILKGLYWLRKAADQGNLNALFHLGLMYQFGNGVKRDMEASNEWYKKACAISTDKKHVQLCKSKGVDIQTGK